MDVGATLVIEDDGGSVEAGVSVGKKLGNKVKTFTGLKVGSCEGFSLEPADSDGKCEGVTDVASTEGLVLGRSCEG